MWQVYRTYTDTDQKDFSELLELFNEHEVAYIVGVWKLLA